MSEVVSFLKLEDLLFPGTVTLLSAIQLTHFAKSVGMLRRKLKIPYPEIKGDPAFERGFRAQMNTLEFHPIFMSCLWLSSIFFHPGAAAGVGVIYLYSRQKYFNGYLQSVEGRLPGFMLGVKCLQIFLLMSVSGLVTLGVRKYADIDLAQITCSYLHKVSPWK